MYLQINGSQIENKQKNGHSDGWTYKWIDIQMDGQTDEW